MFFIVFNRRMRSSKTIMSFSRRSNPKTGRVFLCSAVSFFVSCRFVRCDCRFKKRHACRFDQSSEAHLFFPSCLFDRENIRGSAQSRNGIGRFSLSLSLSLLLPAPCNVSTLDLSFLSFVLYYILCIVLLNWTCAGIFTLSPKSLCALCLCLCLCLSTS
jgi:hypothetical protein